MKRTNNYYSIIIIYKSLTLIEMVI